MTGKQRIEGVIAGEETDCLPFMPITMMFASNFAGVKYGDYARDYRVLAETQLRVAEAFDFDFVSTISDPGREAADCGASIIYFQDQPPAIDEANALLADKNVLVSLKQPDPLGGGRMHDRVQAVAMLRERVGKDKVVEGWIEGPCAEGADLRGINTLMMDFYEDPEFVRDLFDFIIDMELSFAKAQVQAGADSIGLGDAAASLIGPHLYEEFVWSHEKELVDAIHAMGAKVRLHICGNTSPLLAAIGRLGCDIVDLDYEAGVAAAREAMGDRQVLLGNIDPVRVLRDQSPEQVTAAIAECHWAAGSRYIVSAGCEVPRDTPPDNVRAMRDYARASIGRQSREGLRQSGAVLP